MSIDKLVVSPCSNPELELDDVLAAYSGMGYRYFEAFTSWARSAFDWKADPMFYVEKGKEYGMAFHSMHLPEIDAARIDETLSEAVEAARFAESIGVEIVMYKASDRSTYIKAARAFLDAIDDVNVTPVIQNHDGTPLTTLENIGEVINGVNDARLRTLLEVGHLFSAGFTWQAGYEVLSDSIALVHIKDQIGKQSVPFGEGDIDLPGLFAHMETVGYTGKYVVEMEVADHENTLTYLQAALEYLQNLCIKEKP